MCRVRSVFCGVKSFVLGRLGDCVFVCGVSLFIGVSCSCGLHVVYLSGLCVSSFHVFVVGLFCVLVCVSKSVVFGLHVWLPDAMEGPIPVSSLIHSATLVVVGVVFVFVHVVCVSLCCGFCDVMVLVFGSFVYLCVVVCGLWDVKRVVAFGTVFVVSFGVCLCFVVSVFSGLFVLGVHMHYKSVLFVFLGLVFHGFSGVQDLRVLSVFCVCTLVFGL